MPIYGPTGGDFQRDVAGYLNRGVAGAGQGLAQGIMQRAIFREQKRLSNIDNQWKMLDTIAKSQYGGDYSRAFKQNEKQALSLLHNMFPEDEDTANLIYKGIADGNQTAQQMFTQKYEQYLQELQGLAQEQQNNAQNMQQIATQGRVQPRMTVGETAARNPGAYLQMQGGGQQQPQAPTGSGIVDMSMLQGQGAGLTPEPVQPETGGVAQTTTTTDDSATQAYQLLRESFARRMQTGGGRGSQANQFLLAKQDIMNNPDVPPAVKEAAAKITQPQIMQGPEPEAQTTTTPQAGQPAQEQVQRQAQEPMDIVQQHRADIGQYQEVYAETGSHYETEKQVVGFNEPDIHEAVDQLKKTGKVQNEDVKSFLSEHNLPETAEGVAQALTYMNTVIMGRDLPPNTTRFGGLGDAAMERYSELTGLLSGEPANQDWLQKERAGVQVAPTSEQLTSNLGEGYTVKRETADGWLVNTPEGKGQFISKEQALRNGLIELDPVVQGLQSAYELTPQSAIALNGFISNKEGLSPKDRKLAESTMQRIMKAAEVNANTPQNKKAYFEGGQEAAATATQANIDPVLDIMINSMDGETYDERVRNLNKAYMPANIQEERRFSELIRQFDANYGLQIERLALDQQLAYLNYMASKGLENAINGMSLAEIQKAALETGGKTYQDTRNKLLEESKNSEEFRKKHLQQRESDPAYKAADDQIIKGIASVLGVEVQNVTETIPDLSIWASGIRHSLFGKGTTATIPQYGVQISPELLEGTGESQAYKDLLNQLTQE